MITVEHDGKELTLRQLSSEVDLSYNLLLRRYKNGQRGKKLVEPKQKYCKLGNVISYNGKSQNMAAWAKELGISREAMRQRVLKGLPLDVILTTGSVPGKKLSTLV